jgi:hypothetical protein
MKNVFAVPLFPLKGNHWDATHWTFVFEVTVGGIVSVHAMHKWWSGSTNLFRVAIK